MKKIKKKLIKIICLLIPVKKWRKKARSYLTNLRSFRIGKRNELMLRDLNEKVDKLTYRQDLFMDYYVDTSKLLNATGALRDRQLKFNVLLQKIVNILEQNNLDYWLDFGTLLGAVRHKGFVPWDDDADIGIFEKDFKTIWSLLQKEMTKMGNNYVFDDYGERSYKFDSGQLMAIRDLDESVFVDIYTYREIPEKNGALRCEGFNKPNEDNFKSIYKNYSRPFPKEALSPFKKMRFEDREYNVPNDYDAYLQARYGNYMRMPKGKHFVSHGHLEEHKIFYPDLEPVKTN